MTIYPPDVSITYEKLWDKASWRHRIAPLGISDTGWARIDPRLRGPLALEVLIHELLHRLEPEWPEWRVWAAAKWLANHLWAQGYRKFPGLVPLTKTHGGFPRK